MCENVLIYVALAARPPYGGGINHFSFLARYVSSGLLNRCKYCWYPFQDVSKRPQKEHAVEIIRKYSLTVVAQYFISAGSKIYKELVKNPQCMLKRHAGMHTWCKRTSEESGTIGGRKEKELVADDLTTGKHPTI